MAADTFTAPFSRPFRCGLLRRGLQETADQRDLAKFSLHAFALKRTRDRVADAADTLPQGLYCFPFTLVNFGERRALKGFSLELNDIIFKLRLRDRPY